MADSKCSQARRRQRQGRQQQLPARFTPTGDEVLWGIIGINAAVFVGWQYVKMTNSKGDWHCGASTQSTFFFSATTTAIAALPLPPTTNLATNATPQPKLTPTANILRQLLPPCPRHITACYVNSLLFAFYTLIPPSLTLYARSSWNRFHVLQLYDIVAQSSQWPCVDVDD